MRHASPCGSLWLAILVSLAACQVSSRASPCRVAGCEPQQCGSDDHGCDAIVLQGVWIWDGRACVAAYASGCGTVGEDCDSLFPTEQACKSAYAHCASCGR